MTVLEAPPGAVPTPEPAAAAMCGGRPPRPPRTPPPPRRPPQPKRARPPLTRGEAIARSIAATLAVMLMMFVLNLTVSTIARRLARKRGPRVAKTVAAGTSQGA